MPDLSSAFVVLAKPDVATSFWFHSEGGIDLLGSGPDFYVIRSKNKGKSNFCNFFPIPLWCDWMLLEFPLLFMSLVF